MSTYEISKSSLLSLKAEILRKQEELSKIKAENEVKIKNLKKNAPLDLKNKGVEQRQALDSVEDENLLLKSREALEAKSRLYDKLTKNIHKLSEKEAEYYRRYLVRFDKKSKAPDLPPSDSEEDFDPDDDIIHDNYEPPKNRDEEWVEYVDCLGRTRTCLRKDLDYLKRKDRDLEDIVEAKRARKSRSPTPKRVEPPKEKTPEKDEFNEENELLSGEMRREILRRQWEREEEELRDKRDIHYQDILFNEARSHGVGYYGFSKDEDVRAKQQEALNKLRKETQEQQKKSQELKAKREKQLAARVRAATNRKRERMGLAPLEDTPEPPPEPEKIEPAEKIDEKEVKKEEKRKKHIRPWDFGKEGVKSHYEHTQEEWVEKKRRERDSEFAPPSSYRKHKSEDHREKRRDKGKEKRREFRAAPIINELSDDEDYKSYKKQKGAEIPPPNFYGNSRSQSSSSGNMSESIDAGLKFLREQLEKKQ